MAKPAFKRFLEALHQGLDWDGASDHPATRELLEEVFKARYHVKDWKLFQTRVNLQKGEEAASYAGWITANNHTSGTYSGTSFVWFPSSAGSVAASVVGTAGFGDDAAILSRPGHRRRIQALSRLHGRRIWVKPDLLDTASSVPSNVTDRWPEIDRALKAYEDVIYAAVPVPGDDSERAVEAVEDLLDLFFSEHGVRFKKGAETRWKAQEHELLARIFPKRSPEDVRKLLESRRYVVLEGPPGTGKTRLAREIGDHFGDPTVIQFHPARTYEDFVVGLAPQPADQGEGLAFHVRPGDLLRANQCARQGPHVLVIDEINRGDLARVLGEAIFLFEVGEQDRTVDLPHEVRLDPESPPSRKLGLQPELMVLGTRNTADRSIARVDLAIRRRFAFVPVWPDAEVVKTQGEPLATELFQDVLQTFTEFADDEALHLTPGHAYFLDPRSEPTEDGRRERIAQRIRFELVPLLRDYVTERLAGPATSELQGLVERIEARLDAEAA